MTERVESKEKKAEALFLAYWNEQRKEAVSVMLRSRLAEQTERYDADEIEEMFTDSVEREKRFCKKIIKAFCRWDEESDPIVLWDIDETLGSSTFRMEEKQLVTQFNPRPEITHFFDFLQKNFPHIKHGILSTRDSLPEQLNGTVRGGISGFADYIDKDYVYSSQGKLRSVSVPNEDRMKQEFERCGLMVDDGSLKKLTIIEELKSRGLNVKLVDDAVVADYLEKKGNGICVKKEQPRV